MFKVIVVDDEPLMLEGWKAMVDWRACGYELCGTATDGLEALASIRDCNPDLVVTDIRMPVLDGLGLIRTMKEELGLSAKTVVVSGYSEFGYAQQALRYQVDHYVLKPLVTEEIHALLQELTGPLEERRRVEASAAKERSAAAAAAIVNLLRGGEPEAVDAARRLLGLSEQTRCFMILAELPNAQTGSRESAACSLDVSEGIQALAEACLDNGLRAWPFEDAPGRSGLLVIEDGSPDALLEVRLEPIFATLGEPLKGIALYCSGSAFGSGVLPDLYRQAMETRSRGRFESRAGLYRFREPAVSSECRLEDVTERAELLLRAIQAGDEKGIDRTVNGLLRLIERTASKEDWMRTVVRHISGELLRRKAGPRTNPEGTSGLLRQLLLSGEFAGASSWSGEKLKRLCIQASRRMRERENDAISDAVAYLNLHYREKIRLQELAERYHLNPAYFGQQFKQETGSSFHDYIHRLRIDEARRLLRRTDMLVADIASSLGYHDTDYFTQRFKAITGVLPSSYKNSRQG